MTGASKTKRSENTNEPSTHRSPAWTTLTRIKSASSDPVDHPDVQTTYLRRMLTVFWWTALTFSFFFWAAFAFTGNQRVGMIGALVLVFAILVST
ncbi:MAG: hypothetical protein ACRDSJ_17415, partial [Rubrobacteraceae bacterium]